MKIISHGLAASLALVASVATARAQGVPTAAELARACGADINRLCPGVPPGNGRLKACMKAHLSEVSAGCFDTVMAAMAIVYTLNSDLLFPPGGWQLSEAGQREIAMLAHKLAPAQQHVLYISGFTDSTPIGPELAAQGITSNEILSQRRADAVMQFMISQGVRPQMLAAKGFGAADPVASNATAAGRAKNRRVELSMRPL